MRKDVSPMTRRDELRVAAESGADPRTVRKVAMGLSVTESVAQSIRDAAAKLGIRLSRRAA